MSKLPSTAEVYVTKLAAARRLLRAAIRMYFHAEDELAVHAVVAAAYGILKDLKAARGENEAAFANETFVRGLLVMAQRKVRGKLEPEVLRDKATVEILDRLITHLKLEADTDLSQLGLAVAADAKATSAYWRTTNRASNFLKHADRDSQAVLALSEVEKSRLLMTSMLSYESIAPDDLGYEGFVLQVHFMASTDSPCESDDPRGPLVEEVRNLKPEDRIAFSAYQLDQGPPAGWN